jgi:hypothetical protein
MKDKSDFVFMIVQYGLLIVLIIGFFVCVNQMQKNDNYFSFNVWKSNITVNPSCYYKEQSIENINACKELTKSFLDSEVKS